MLRAACLQPAKAGREVGELLYTAEHQADWNNFYHPVGGRTRKQEKTNKLDYHLPLSGGRKLDQAVFSGLRPLWNIKQSSATNEAYNLWKECPQRCTAGFVTAQQRLNTGKPQNRKEQGHVESGRLPLVAGGSANLCGSCKPTATSRWSHVHGHWSQDRR